MLSKCRYTEVAATPTSRATARRVSGGAAGSASSRLAASMMSSRRRSPWPRGFRFLVICLAGPVLAGLVLAGIVLAGIVTSSVFGKTTSVALQVKVPARYYLTPVRLQSYSQFNKTDVALQMEP